MYSFEPTNDERRAAREKFQENWERVEVLYVCDKGCVLRLNEVDLSIWANGRALVTLR
jgi:hypothetical protein